MARVAPFLTHGVYSIQVHCVILLRPLLTLVAQKLSIDCQHI